MATAPQSLRLHDLCPADKQKLGELLQVFSTERRKSRERIGRLESDRKAYKRVICELAKENQALSSETTELQEELQAVLGKLGEVEGCKGGKSALGQVKSFRSELAELSLSLKQLNSASGSRRRVLEATEGRESRREWGSTRRNPLLMLETGRSERSRGGESERDPKNLPSMGNCTVPNPASITYEESLWDLLDSIESGQVSAPPLPRSH